MRENRGILLTVLLVVATIGTISPIIACFIILRLFFAGEVSFLVVPIFALIAVYNLSTTIGLWLWKKWAVYLLLFACGLAFILGIIGLFLSGNLEFYSINLLVISFLALLWILAIFPRWHYFK